MIFSRFTVSTFVLLFVCIVISSCSKIVEVELPDSEPFLVVEGSIRNGEIPLVLLSKSAGYFDPISVTQQLGNPKSNLVNFILQNGSTAI